MAVNKWENYKLLLKFVKERLTYCAELCLERADKLGLDKDIVILELVSQLSAIANARTYQDFVALDKQDSTE